MLALPEDAWVDHARIATEMHLSGFVGALHRADGSGPAGSAERPSVRPTRRRPPLWASRRPWAWRQGRP